MKNAHIRINLKKIHDENEKKSMQSFLFPILILPHNILLNLF